MQRLRGLFQDSSNTTMGIIVVASALLLLIIVPQVIPGGRFGVSCNALAHPIADGNHQSLLAARSEGALQLVIDVQYENISPGDPLVVNATFINEGVGTITLFLIPEEALLRDDGTPGLNFQVQRLSDLATFPEPTTTRPPNPQRTTFASEVLYILGPKQRCTQQLVFDGIRLNNMGLVPGRYSIQATYRNPFRGTINISPAATATPIFPDQGVYVTQELRSNDVIFSLGIQQQVTIVPPGEAPPLGG